MSDLQGISPQFGERILYADGPNAQNVLPDLLQLPLELVARLDERLRQRRAFFSGSRKRLEIYLAAGRQRKRLEDHDRGRTYLPAEDLRRFGCPDLFTAPAPDAARLIRFEAERATQWFDHGLELVELLDRRSAACVLAMTGIYRGILERIALQPTEVLERRISLPVWEKAWVAARSLSRRQTGGVPPALHGARAA